ncbi:MAG: protein phosphatase 2C domain-containing protein [Myxococcales bacterium]|nr:protein phosphatase 2C domain-containing protein [Myxococcales bacterium]
MALRIESAGKTDVGLVREKNEDSMLIDPTVGLYVVCDGMGGHVGGQVASQLAVASISEVIRSSSGAVGDDADKLVSAIKAANQAVFTKAKADPSLHNMGTTVVAIRQDADLLQLAHVGDSRIYRLRQGKFEQVTRDHSLINLYEENPELAARFGPPNSNVIVRAVGLRAEVEVDHRVIAMEPGDMYLLCCDGLTDMVDDWMLKEMLADATEGSLDEACEALVRAALSNGGVDNTTVILLRIHETS